MGRIGCSGLCILIRPFMDGGLGLNWCISIFLPVGLVVYCFCFSDLCLVRFGWVCFGCLEIIIV